MNKQNFATGGGDNCVLIVEDIEANVFVASIYLENMGYCYEVAENGAEAVEMCKAKKFDAILMDIHMPVMDGYEASVKIREYEKQAVARRTPIIAVTAHVGTESREKCLSAGMDEFILKPLSEEELRAKIARLTS